MTQQLDVAISHLETMVERVTNSDKAIPDQDGDYFIETEHGGFFARVDGGETPILRVFTIISKDIDCSADLLTELNEFNRRLTFSRVIWVGDQVLMETNAIALETSTNEFNTMCLEVARASDFLGPRILEEFGGVAFFSQTREPDQAPPAPPDWPGYI